MINDKQKTQPTAPLTQTVINGKKVYQSKTIYGKPLTTDLPKKK